MLTAPAPITITPKGHRFFDPLVTALAAYCATSAGYTTHITGEAYRFIGDKTLRMVCFTQCEGRSSLEIEIHPSTILQPLTSQSWPASLDLRFEVVTDVSIPPAPPLRAYAGTLGGMQRVGANIFEHAFVTYYESIVPIASARYGKVKDWPSTLQFARTVRNAFAHGGTLNITDDRPTGSWNGLTYTDSDNGRQLAYNDLTLGDVVLLMIETDRLL